jgi:hypothetical protein
MKKVSMQLWQYKWLSCSPLLLLVLGTVTFDPQLSGLRHISLLLPHIESMKFNQGFPLSYDSEMHTLSILDAAISKVSKQAKWQKKYTSS